MTEQEKTSAVVEETREAVDTTSQPVATEKKSKKQYRIDSQRGGYRYCSGGGHRFVWLG